MDNSTTLVVVLLLFGAVSYLLYLDWYRQGQYEYVEQRLDKLEKAVSEHGKGTPRKPRARSEHSKADEA